MICLCSAFIIYLKSLVNKNDSFLYADTLHLMIWLICRYYIFFVAAGVFYLMSFPSLSSAFPQYPLGRTSQEGMRRQWLLGLYHWEFRASAFQTKCDFSAGARTENWWQKSIQGASPQILFGVTVRVSYLLSHPKTKRRKQQPSAVLSSSPGIIWFAHQNNPSGLGDKTWNQRINYKAQHYWRFILCGNNGKGRSLAFFFRGNLGTW